MKFAVIATLWLLMGASALAQGGTGVVDAKALAKIQSQEAVVAAKKIELAEANTALQDDYARLQKLFQEARNGSDKSAVKDIVRVLESPLKDVNSNIRSGRKTKKILRGFSKEVAKATSKIEHPLLLTLKKEMKGAFTLSLENWLKDEQKEVDGEEFARAVIRRLLPKDTQFHQLWNDVILSSAPKRSDYIAAFDSLKSSEETLLVLKDPKMKYTVGAPPKMAKIPGGKIIIESSYGFSTKKRRAKVKAFYIDLFEVTHGEYWSKFWVLLKDKTLKAAYMPKFTDSKGRELPQWVQDPDTGEYAPLDAHMTLPVTGVDLLAARAYAKSQGKRLPTEAEWMAAATAKPGKTTEFPWGDKWFPESCNDGKAKNRKPVTVGTYPKGRSFYGLYDMSGNVKEWINSTIEGKDCKDNLKEGTTVIVRGGSFNSSQPGVSLKWRWQLPASGTHQKDVGFRCAQSVEKK